MGIDPATRCGYAIGHVKCEIPDVSGVWDLSNNENNGGRLLNLDMCLNAMIDQEAPDAIVFERPGLLRGKANVVLPALVGVIELVAARRDILVHEVTPSFVKKHATGKGNADKIQMVASAQRRWPSIVFESGDHADACWIWDSFRENLHGTS